MVESLNKINQSKCGQDDFKVEDIPQNLTPASILLEVITNIENIKLKSQELSQQEQEFDDIIRSLKTDKQIVTCSNTLQLLIQKTKV